MGFVVKTVYGSSPHARGLLTDRQQAVPTTRIIPAHAGFTATSGVEMPWNGDHPRTRGVYQILKH